VRNEKAHEHRYHRSPNVPALPAQWLTAYFVLSPVNRAFLPPSPVKLIYELDPSVGGPRPHDFAVRPAALVCAVKASIASRATFPDDREAPLLMKRGMKQPYI
jgi:hypothetical protein